MNYMNRKKRYHFSGLAALSCLALFSGACQKTGPVLPERDTISFYVKARPSEGTRAIVDDTETLTRLGLPIYVTDGLTSPAFSDTKVAYTANGVWKSNVGWNTAKEYSLFAYIQSEPEGTDYVSAIANNGYSLILQQPNAYEKGDDKWTDFLMSYRVKVNGADKPLVKLDFERITACVELYAAMGQNMTEVSIKEIEFRNIHTRAKYELKYHAVPGDNNDNFGMKNTWAVTLDESCLNTYEFVPLTDLEAGLDYVGADRFAPDHLKMRFLAVQQDVQDIVLYISYQVLEQETLSEYEAEFPLAEYTPMVWNRGHKIRYYIGIDSSIGLEGTVEEWKTVEFIETTLLPD